MTKHYPRLIYLIRNPEIRLEPEN